MDLPALILHDRDQSDLLLAREQFLAGDPLPGGVRPPVLESWQRSLQFGIDPRRMRGQTRDDKALLLAQECASDLLRSAAPHFEHVHATLAGCPHLVALSDVEGRILRLLSGGDLDPAEMERANLFEGACWAEADIGSNAVGTALASGDDSILIGPEHFHESYLGWSCIGVPVRDPGGTIVGVFALSLPNGNVQVQSWGWAISVARGIEMGLATPIVGRPSNAHPAVGVSEKPLQSIEVSAALEPGADPYSAHRRVMEEVRAGGGGGGIGPEE